MKTVDKTKERPPTSEAVDEFKGEVEVILISGDKRIDYMMHAAGMFEDFKVLGDIKRIVLTTNSKFNEARTIKEIKKGLEKDYRVTAVFVPGHPDTAYFDPAVKAVSNGYKFTFISAIRKAYGVEAPEHQTETE